MSNQTNSVVANITEVRAQAQLVIAAKLKAAKEAAEMKLLTNEVFQEAMVQQALREQTTDKLAELNTQCEAIVAGNPVYNKTLKQNRTWNPSRRYGFGNQFAALSGLLSGIQYSVNEHATLMLAITGLSPDLIERTLDALGQLPYFSTNNNIVVEGKQTNVNELIECIQLLELSLGVTVDKSQITQKVADHQYEIAMVKAEAAQAEAEVALTLENLIIR